VQSAAEREEDVIEEVARRLQVTATTRAPS